MLPTPRCGSIQLAKSPVSETCSAPKTVASTCPPTNHGKGMGRAEEGHPWHRLEELSARVDKVDILLALVGQRSAIQHTALAVVEHSEVRWQEVGHQRRNADAKVDVRAVLQLLRHPHRNNLALQPLFNHSVPRLCRSIWSPHSISEVESASVAVCVPASRSRSLSILNTRPHSPESLQGLVSSEASRIRRDQEVEGELYSSSIGW